MAEQLSKNFTREEFACKCGCGFDTINPLIVEFCQKIRDAIGKPVRVNSGCRCEKRNKQAGSTSMNHIHGNAADLSSELGHKALWVTAHELFDAGQLPGLELALLEGSWLHIDCDRPRSKVFQVL